ncbi:M35 family metallo-endopeptidase [Streptomyces sp. TRM68416]|uniref:M35 family metallo-endopeptidase n=1 Tax=Streptomyces sp. TRM68416 TaxID=2758412 RepID=UPI003980A2B2
MAAKAVAQLTGTNPSANQHYRRWFGFNSALFDFMGGLPLYNAVTMHSDGIRTTLAAPCFIPLPLTYDLTGTGCRPGWFAYTYPNARTVWLCSRFWIAPLFAVPDRHRCLPHPGHK